MLWFPITIKNVEKKSKNCKIRKKYKNFEISYKNLEKYGSFSEFRTFTEKSVMLATLSGCPIPFTDSPFHLFPFSYLVPQGVGLRAFYHILEDCPQHFDAIKPCLSIFSFSLTHSGYFSWAILISMFNKNWHVHLLNISCSLWNHWYTQPIDLKFHKNILDWNWNMVDWVELCQCYHMVSTKSSQNLFDISYITGLEVKSDN